MAPQNEVRQEVRVFERNAKEGARSVVFYWLSRRLVLPVGLILLGTIIAAFVNNGPIAGGLSLLIFVPLLILVWGLWSGQFRKIWKYWTN